MLRYLDERGIRPGSELEVTGRDPFEGPLHVTVAGADHILGERLAGAIRVVAQ
jgi:Fe2+ transport system protein FeoA